MNRQTAALFLAASLLLPAVTTARADYIVQRKSEFQVKKVPHDIFWPIGYVHVENSAISPRTSAPLPAVSLGPDRFVVSSILISAGLPLAVINGQARAEGEFLLIDGVRVEVVKIRDGTVQLNYEGNSLTVKQRR